VAEDKGTSKVFYNTWLSDAWLNNAVLHEADLSRAILGDANLSNAYLDNANLSGADIDNANISYANLSNANLSKADLSYTRQLHFVRGHLPEVSFGENLFSLRERRNVGLEGGGHLLQVSKSQAFGIAKTVAVALMMDATISRPIGSSRGSRGAQTSKLSQEAERRERGQPFKPLSSIRKHSQLAIGWTDDHIRASCSVGDEGKLAPAPS
jgi:hypothetical protein